MNKANSIYREIASRLEESARVKKIMAKGQIGEIERMVNFIVSVYRVGGKVVLLGNGGQLAEEADLAIRVPSDNTPGIQEAHITIGHIVCELVERELFGTD